MTVEVLLSCMHLNNDDDVLDLVRRTNIKGKAVVVSQCDKDAVSTVGDVRIIYSTDRGLSKSRNLAVKHSTEDVCLICDDDETLDDNVEKIIKDAYDENPSAALIAFALNRRDCNKTYPDKEMPLGFRQILKTSSLQISFRRSEMIRYKISFDEKMGSGTGNGGGEENKFLLDFKRKNCKMIFHPAVIATINPGESQWFSGYDKKYISDLGWSSRRSMGNAVGFLYIHYWLLSHYRLYSSEVSFMSAYKNIISGYFSKR